MPVGRSFTGVVDANGLPTVYDQTWQGYSNLTPAQQTWFRSQPQWLKYYLGYKRWTKEIGGITVNSLPIDTTDPSRSLIDGLGLRALRDQQGNPSATYTFTLRGRVVQLSVAQALALFDAVSGFIQACRAAEGNLLSQIGTTITSEAQIDTALAAVPTSF